MGVFAFLLLASTAARASWPDDVVLTNLGEWNGSPVGPRVAGAAYEQVVRELAVGISNPPLSAARTGGLAGFDVALTSTVGFIDATTDDPAEHPTAWHRVDADGDPTGALWVPALAVRKGLPLSLEVGARMGYVAFSRQGVFGAWGRWALLEGYRSAPDLAVQVGYSGYVGNDELELGVLDASATIGYTLPFGRLVGVNDGDFSPYVGVGMLSIRAEPRLDSATMEDLGIGPVRSSPKSPDYAEGFRPIEAHLGFRIRSGNVQGLLAATWAPSVMPAVHVGFGHLF